MILLIVLLVLGVPTFAFPATYYVATTGSDTVGTGSSGNPWRNPQKCVSSGTPLVAGDTCIVRDGTYTDLDGDGIVIRVIGGTAPSGTAVNPVTIKSENPSGAVISIINQPGGTLSNHGIRITAPYYIIDGFDIDGSPVTSKEAVHGITFATGSDGGIARNNKIHHMGRNVCALIADDVVSVGISLSAGVNNLLIEKNLIYSVGKRRNGESGCTTDEFQRDHGIYGSGANHIIRRNIIYDTNRGYPIHFYGGTTTNLLIEHNTLYGTAPLGAGGPSFPNGWPTAQIRLASTVNGAIVRNNISAGNNGQVLHGLMNAQSTTHSNVVVSYNISDGVANSWGSSISGVTFSNNTENSSSINLANAGSNDFTLLATSAAIDTGTAYTGAVYNGSAPDKGAFETFTFASCEVPNGAAGTIQATFTNNLNPPLRSPYTTFTARRNGSNNALTGAATRIGDNLLSFPLTTPYVGGDTADLSRSSGGLTDSALIAGTLNQPYVQTLTNQSCTNNAGGAPTYVLTQARHQFRGVHGPETTTDIRGADNATPYEVQQGGAARVRFAVTDATANAPDGTAFFLRYSKDSGPYTTVPDTYGADGIAACAGNITVREVTNATPTTDQLTAVAGTFIPGGVILSSNAVPTINGLNTGYKTELEYCISFTSAASGSFLLRIYQQNGTALNTYTTTPEIRIVNPKTTTGFR